MSCWKLSALTCLLWIVRQSAFQMSGVCVWRSQLAGWLFKCYRNFEYQGIHIVYMWTVDTDTSQRCMRFTKIGNKLSSFHLSSFPRKKWSKRTCIDAQFSLGKLRFSVDSVFPPTYIKHRSNRKVLLRLFDLGILGSSC